MCIKMPLSNRQANPLFCPQFSLAVLSLQDLARNAGASGSVDVAPELGHFPGPILTPGSACEFHEVGP